MRELKEILKKNNIIARGYHKIGNSIIIEDNNKKYVVNKHKYKKDILKYLNSRNFNYYPKIYDSTDDYDITEYIDQCLEWANRDKAFGYGLQLTKEDMYFGGCNIGFEIHGNYDCTVEFKNLDMIAYDK